jgi:Spy/CpxP family protein refolding chaperone
MKATRTLTLLGLATLLALAPTASFAQDNGDRGGRGNFDPAEFQKRMLERTRELLEITDDEEWKAIEPLVTKVNEARMASLTTRGFGGRGGRGPGGPGGFGQPNPDVEQLQKVIDAKASNAETKAALDKFVAARKAKQAELEKAQATLRKVLTPRQEAIATLNGLL